MFSSQVQKSENPIVWADLEQIVAEHCHWDFYRNQTVFVTGGAGLLASYLVRALLLANDYLDLKIRLTCLLRSVPSDGSRLNPWLHHPNLNLVYGNAENYPYGQLESQDFVVHAASSASPRAYSEDPVGILLPNSVGTAQLCESARKWGSKRFLFFSTGEVYGVNSKEKLDELDFGYLDPNTVRSCYAESKRMGETTCRAYAHQYGLSATCARIFHTYGPQMALDDGRVFSDFVRDALNGQPISLASNGTARRCFCYLGDATAAFLQLLKGGRPGEAYNLANPDTETSIIDLAHLIGGLVEPKLEVWSVNPGIAKPNYMASPVPRSLPSIAKLQALGWRPTTDLESGFRRTLLSYHVY
jgi:nucleoside-diphosphate-sugar epimerase